MPQQPSLPEPADVLYKMPNVDGERKACKNCAMWLQAEQECAIHAKGVDVPGSYFCGYHVEGAPMQQRMDHPGGMTPVDPSLSGLRDAGRGLACDNCAFYMKRTEEGGFCTVVANATSKMPPAPVFGLGVCARHRPA